jgi:DNA polymerase-4
MAPAQPDAICRGCGAYVRQAPCPECSDTRLLSHTELGALSIAHLDCDAFYAQLEKRDDPSLAGKAVIVGGGKRGVVTTCCHVARAFGVRSAMPMFKALMLCPHATIIPPNIAKYAGVGAGVRALMQELTPLVQPLSIDEAFMDLSGTDALHGGAPARMLVRLQTRIEREIGITVSIGLSFNKFLAKMASDLDKPRGFSVVVRADALDFLATRPVGALSGVGPAAVEVLERSGLRLVGDIRRTGKQAMERKHGDWGARLYAFSIAEDARPVHAGGERKSISAEPTFSEDLAGREALEDILWRLCEKVAARARDGCMAGRTITLKLKTARFRSLTRRATLAEPTLLARRLFETARLLLAEETHGQSYRLIGIGLSDFVDSAEADHGDLMDKRTPRLAAAEAAIAAARDKYGGAIIRSGRELKATRREE